MTNEGWAAFKSSPYGQVSAIGNQVYVREDQEGGVPGSVVKPKML